MTPDEDPETLLDGFDAMYEKLKALGDEGERLWRKLAPLPPRRPWWWIWRVRFKVWLSRRRLLVEFCKDCGVEQPLVWHAPDGLWLQLMRHPGGVVCPRCFDRRAVALGIAVVWEPRVEITGRGPLIRPAERLEDS